MSADIMSKIAAVLFSEPVDETTQSENVKYGDDDLSSKRRKSENESDDSHECRRSQPSVSQHSEDFTGGLLSDESEAASLETIVDWSRDAADENLDFSISSISSHPSDSSAHFENTFGVLEHYLQRRKQPKLNQRQIEYIMLTNNATAIQNPIYVDIPINDKWCLRAVGGDANEVANDSFVDDEQPPSLFDLEIEAMLRMHELQGSQSDRSSDSIAASATASDTQTATSTSLLEDFYQQDERCGSSDYIYHVARHKDGRVYLRIVRSLVVDRGNGIFICLFHLFATVHSFSRSPGGNSHVYALTQLCNQTAYSESVRCSDEPKCRTEEITILFLLFFFFSFVELLVCSCIHSNMKSTKK